MIYNLEWYLKHCGSHNVMFSICFGSLLSFRKISHAFICLNHSSHLQAALDKSVEIGTVRGQCRPEPYAIALMISPLQHLQYIHYRMAENAFQTMFNTLWRVIYMVEYVHIHYSMMYTYIIPGWREYWYSPGRVIKQSGGEYDTTSPIWFMVICAPDML